MGPDPLSDRPSPRGGGPSIAAIEAARRLIAIAERGELDRDGLAMAVWVGQATATLRELTRDA